MVWEYGEEELQKFSEALDCYHPTMKYTGKYCTTQINSLDVTVIKKGNPRVSDLYVKPTDPHQYLQVSLYHVCHC